jgi:hypothetical protein
MPFGKDVDDTPSFRSSVSSLFTSRMFLLINNWPLIWALQKRNSMQTPLFRQAAMT